MMELSHSLTLNEEALQQIPEAKRSVFVFEWLRFLDKVLVAAQKSDIRGCQQKLVQQLTRHAHESPGPPTRRLIARCLATLFSVGDTFLLFDTVNKCNDILRSKDDSPSFLLTRLAAICCVGCMYEKLGRMMGRSYEETVQILIKSLRSAESQTRLEIMITLRKVCSGMGNAITNVHKDIYKAVRQCLADRVMAVRCAAAECLTQMLSDAQFLYTSELENVATLCFRALDGSNYEVRCAVAKLLGNLIAATQLNQKGPQAKGSKPTSLEEALGVLMSGFLRGGIGFLKGTGEMIKGSGVSREVRVGVTHAYVVFALAMGGAWAERNLSVLLAHVLELAASPKAASSHVDAVYSRKCISFILRTLLGRMLGEKAQAAACKDVAHLVAKQMSTLDFSPENAKDCNQETLFSQHLLVCALQEEGLLLMGLGTAAAALTADPSLNLIDTVVAVLMHPCQAARLAAAWCLRCVCVAVPSQISHLIDRCVDGFDSVKTSPEGIAGFSAALAAVLGGVRLSPLGVPHTKGKVIFNTAEELLRTASQNSRLSLHRTQAGWLLIGAVMTLGLPVVRGLLPRMLLLWRNSFPRSNKELESEKARGDAFTWQVTLEGRAGALSSMHSFLQHCPELATDDIIRRLLTPVESALSMLSSISAVLRAYGQHLKAPAAMVRLRLYQTLTLLPPQAFEGCYTQLLRMLVGEFTLAENPSNTTTSLLKAVCHADESVILGTWLHASDHRCVEEQLQPNSAAGSGALEHDPCCLYQPVPQGESIPGPLPLGVVVIDRSVTLFGQIFPHVANKHRLQMLEHFTECIRHSKSARQEAVQTNVFTAVLCGLKGLADAKAAFGQEDVKKSATALLVGALTSPSPALRCAAGEALGRLAQAVGDSRFTAELAQTSFDRLKSARDAGSRTGHSLALGCLHRYVGSMGSGQHLNTSVSILLALAQDSASPPVQVWSLHALALIAGSGGPMYRGYVEPTLSLVLRLLLSVPQSHTDVHQCLGRLLAAIITTVGPELQGNTTSVCTARSSFLCACAIMQEHADPLVRAEATGCLQQLHLFAPRYVNLSSLVPTLCRTLTSRHLLLRKAAVSCLRQLAQREAREVCEHASSLASESRDAGAIEGTVITETGLPGVLFSLLDTETDPGLVQDIHDTLTSMLQMLAADNLSQWLALCKDVLTVATEASAPAAAAPDDPAAAAGAGSASVSGAGASTGADEGDEEEADDDQAEFHAEREPAAGRAAAVQPRWPTRVFAAECVRRVMAACAAVAGPHFDLALAKEMQLTRSRGDYLVLHLPDLIRMAFMAATSDSDPLRLEGLRTLQEVIERFAHVPEPEFPGHLLLEQFQAQVGAALRPAFSPDTPSHVTAAACQVCSAWLGSGVARDLSDLRRVYQLLVTSLGKLQRGSGAPQLFNESLATLERLAILRAWAEVYFVAMKGSGLIPEQPDMEQSHPTARTTAGDSDSDPEGEEAEGEDFGEFEFRGESLLALVQPQLFSLSQFWLAALRDYALLSLPPEFASQLPHDGGAFYTTDTADLSRPHYTACWPPILRAVALWLHAGGLDKGDKASYEASVSAKINTYIALRSNANCFHMLFGICMEALCSPRAGDTRSDCLLTCLQALHTLLQSAWARAALAEDRRVPIELANVLHRLLLTQDSPRLHLLVLQLLRQLVTAAHELADRPCKDKDADAAPEDPSVAGESDLTPGRSLVFAVLEVCLCLLVRRLPSLARSVSGSAHSACIVGQLQHSDRLAAAALAVMERLPALCSPQGAVSVLPTLLYLSVGALRACSNPLTSARPGSEAVAAALHCLRSLATHEHGRDAQYGEQWNSLLQSALARVLDLTKMAPGEEGRPDEATLLLAVAVFALHAPWEVTSAPGLLYPCINLFQRCLETSDFGVKQKCVQTLSKVFRDSDARIATPFIQALAPRLLHLLLTVPQRQLTTELELGLVTDALQAVETLLGLAQPKHRAQLLTLLLPILVSFLLDESRGPTVPRLARALHEHSLQTLMRIGPTYPKEFKSLMAQSDALRGRVEAAIRGSRAAARRPGPDCAPTALAPRSPTIKLKTDFSNFVS